MELPINADIYCFDLEKHITSIVIAILYRGGNPILVEYTKNKKGFAFKTGSVEGTTLHTKTALFSEMKHRGLSKPTREFILNTNMIAVDSEEYRSMNKVPEPLAKQIEEIVNKTFK